MARPAAAIFDLDGTLVDSLDDITAALDATLAELGLPGCSREQCRDWIGGGARSLVARALPYPRSGPHGDDDDHDSDLERADRTEADALLDRAHRRFMERYRASLVVATYPYPGIAEMLADLTDAGVRLAVLSNKPHEMTQRVIGALFPAVPFAAVAGQRTGVPVKPDPTSALATAATLGVAPAACAFIGDSAIDIQTGRSAGMRAIGVTWGFRPRDELAIAGADAIVDDAPALSALLTDL
jgi:phosphoglycolate phosphatase